MHFETRKLRFLLRTSPAALLLCGTLFLSTGARADIISGTTSLGFGQVGVSIFGTDFFGYNGASSQCDIPGTGSGCFDILSGTGDFAKLVNFNAQANTIQDLPSPPLSGPILKPGFISFDNGAILFDLLNVLPGGGQNCATVANLTAPNISCTVYVDYGTPQNPNMQVSPYLLTNGPDGSAVGVSATMYFAGYSGSAAGGTTLYRGIFSTQLAGVDILDVYGVIASGGTGTSSWSAAFSPMTSQQVAGAPEPASWLLFGAGMIGIAFRIRRRA